MKLKELLTNKKIIIVAFVIVLALIVGGVILVTMDSKETGNKDKDIKTEQSKGEVDSQGEKKDTDANDNENGNSGLQVIEPDNVIPENSSDASGSWDNMSDSGTQSGNTNTNNNTNKTDNQNQNSNSNDSDKEDDEDILEDDIIWSNIY